MSKIIGVTVGTPIKETDPTVPSWAKQPKKPTYTAEEVGALPANTEIPVGACVVTVTYWDTSKTYTADKTSGEIFDAWKANKPIFCKFNYGGIPLVLIPYTCSNLKSMFVLDGGLTGLSGAIIIEGSTVTAEISESPLLSILEHITENYQPKGDYVTVEVAEQLLDDYVRKDELPDTGGASAYYVTVTGSNGEYTADKTNAEISEAYESKQPVYCVLTVEEEAFAVENMILPLITFLNGAALFGTYIDGMSVAVVCADSETMVLIKEMASKDDIPSSLPSPGKLIFTGAINETYNGMRDVTIDIPDSGGNVAYDEAQNLTDAQKSQARENIGAQPAGNYLTEVPEGYAKAEDIPTDAEIIQLIKDNAPESSGGIDVTGATVGQTVKITEVDANGVPTAWEPVDFPSGGGSGGDRMRLIADITTTEDLNKIVISEDKDGNPFALTQVAVRGYVSGAENAGGYIGCQLNNKSLYTNVGLTANSIRDYVWTAKLNEDGTVNATFGGGSVNEFVGTNETVAARNRTIYGDKITSLCW